MIIFAAEAMTILPLRDDDTVSGRIDILVYIRERNDSTLNYVGLCRTRLTMHRGIGTVIVRTVDACIQQKKSGCNRSYCPHIKPAYRKSVSKGEVVNGANPRITFIRMNLERVARHYHEFDEGHDSLAININVDFEPQLNIPVTRIMPLSVVMMRSSKDSRLVVSAFVVASRRANAQGN
jgi:hypothetical protein